MSNSKKRNSSNFTSFENNERTSTIIQSPKNKNIIINNFNNISSSSTSFLVKSPSEKNTLYNVEYERDREREFNVNNKGVAQSQNLSDPKVKNSLKKFQSKN